MPGAHPHENVDLHASPPQFVRQGLRLAAVRRFNPYDLYSKSPVPPDWNELRPFYEGLVDRYLPARIDF